MVMTSAEIRFKLILKGWNDSLRTLESSRVGLISPDLSIDLDQALLDNSSDFPAGERIFQPVTEEDGKGETFPEFVGTGGGTGGLSSS